MGIIQKAKANGNLGAWVTRGITVTSVLAILGMVMSQSVDKGKMLKEIEHNGDKNTALEMRIEKRDVKFDTFLMQQTRKNIIDSLNTVVLMKFLEVQIEFNGKIQEHITKDENR